MLTKPFRPPLLQRPIDNVQIPTLDGPGEQPPLKKLRLSPPSEIENAHPSRNTPTLSSQTLHELPKPRPALGLPQRALLQHVTQPAAPETEQKKPQGHEAYYRVVWRKFTTKKNKTWDGDGVLAVFNGLGVLTGDDGKELGKKRIDGPLLPDTMLSISAKDVQVESLMDKHEFMAGKSFLGSTNRSTLTELEQKLRTNAKFKPLSKAAKDQAKENAKPDKSQRTAVPASKATQSSFKTPVLNSTVVPQTQQGKPTPRHDPDAPGAVVMKRPDSVPPGKQIVDVVIDPILSKNLRDHQKEGVKFMYECVMGMQPFSGDGAILADEMGLGKTLQVIALLWTLLRQNPVHGESPVVKKALVVCPVTVIKNWKKEFRKWLGNERIGVFVVNDKKARLSDFTMGKSYNIMIIGYEKLRTITADLQKGSGIDIVIADEGHRLKTATNKSAQAIKALATTRRIILSGTPVQNNLSEYYFLVDFINPGLLGKYNTFKKGFETPILKSRQPEATEREKEIGEAREDELGKLTDLFIIRRTAEILSKYLPSKSEYVLFCKPTSEQAKVYRSVLNSPEFTAILQAPEAALQLISILKKVCNSPSLLQAKDQNTEGNKSNSIISSILTRIPRTLLKSPGASGKLQVLDSLLYRISTSTSEKVVIVSQYTATLDILSNFLDSLSYSHLRLDGSTPQTKRQQLVDRFNRAPASDSFVFLLSAKSGGMGLNLIGASRLILFDNDWNPSTDLQAMARIHRDGQKRACRIYRLLTKGALDEKIFQRQATKLSLADSVVDGKLSSSAFSREELKDLFSLDEGEGCQTHKLLGCGCEGNGRVVATGPDPVAKMDARLKMADVIDDTSEDEEEEEEEETAEGKDEELEGKESLSLKDLVKGTQVEALRKRAALEEEEEKVKKALKEKHKMVTLMQYRHIDVGKLGDVTTGLKRKREKPEEVKTADDAKREDIDKPKSPEEIDGIEDAVLMDVLRDREGLVSYVFAKGK